MTYVTYSANNSGGRDWLSSQDWINLEKAGWEVDWREDRGPRGWSAIRRGLEFRDAVNEWVHITGQDPSDEGCNCCGPPHSFTEYDDNDNYLREVKIDKITTWGIS